MAEATINNVNELRAEIARLRLLKKEQSDVLAKRFNSPLTAISTIYSIFPSSRSGAKNDIFHQDIVGLLSRVVLPFVLNKTLFRNSNFVVKTLVSLLSQKASGFISEESVANAWDKIKAMLTKNKKDVDYGIPPDSEAS